ncbi:MAG: hypothetical protein QXO75_08025 [Nitrososphaerota archaeon]
MRKMEEYNESDDPELSRVIYELSNKVAVLENDMGWIKQAIEDLKTRSDKISSDVNKINEKVSGYMKKLLATILGSMIGFITAMIILLAQAML